MARHVVSATWTVVWFCIFIASVIISIIFSVYVFLPAWKTIKFLPVQCEIVEITKRDLHCICGDQCFSRFVCLSVFVEFADITNSSVSRTVSNCADDEATFLFYGNQRSCSYYPVCNFNKDENNEDTDTYLKTLQIREKRTCHVNKDNQSEVILNKNKTRNLFVLIGTTGSLFLICQVTFLLFAKGMCNNLTIRNINRLFQSC